MRDLRNKVLQAFEDLENGIIDIPMAVTISKLNDSIIAGLRSEMQYAILTDQKIIIPFYEDVPDRIYIQEKDIKKLK